jgi:hypothetical protein
MNKFIERFSSGIAGVLSGFDRLVFRGSFGGGMMGYLWQRQVLLKNFAQHVQQISEGIKTASLRGLADLFQSFLVNVKIGIHVLYVVLVFQGFQQADHGVGG